MTLFAPAKSFSIGAEAPPAFSAAPHRIWSKHPGWRCQYCPPSQFVVALVYHAESLWRKSPKALCIFCFGTFRAATKFSLIFSLMASKFNHTVRQHLTARFLSKPLLPTLSGISQHDTKSPCDNSSPASRTNRKTLEAARLRGLFLFLEAVWPYWSTGGNRAPQTPDRCLSRRPLVSRQAGHGEMGAPSPFLRAIIAP